MKESMVEKMERHEACRAIGVPRQTVFVTCAAHGIRGRIANAYMLNNLWRTDDGEIRCVPDHPYCFDWCDRQSGDA